MRVVGVVNGEVIIYRPLCGGCAVRGADMRAVAREMPYADVGGALCGCGICALRRAGLCSGEMERWYLPF